MFSFKIQSDYKPMGDQPEAIRQLADGVRRGDKSQVLLGVTGSGKTFTMANVIQDVQRPTLILSHNKTLAAQLYAEMKAFFPNNAVEYFVSYYDYYQPEAYIPSTDTYIEKDLSINMEIDKLRLSATAALLSGRRDVVVVSSVSCLYGIGNPADFTNNCITIIKGDLLNREEFLLRLVNSQYTRNELELNRGNFRVKGDTVDIFLAYADYVVRVVFWGNEIDDIYTYEPIDQHVIDEYDMFNIYPASIFNTTKEQALQTIGQIKTDLAAQVDYFRELGKTLEATRLEQRVNYDLEMIQELGYCSGIENYSRYFDHRPPGSRPYCLLDYFPKDFLMIIDESHVTMPQIHAMYGGDAARKQNLVDFGFRLPAAKDNRPLKFEEFKQLTNQVIYVSATPADYELAEAEGVIVEQLIRPTGLLDPEIEVRPSEHQVDDLLEEVAQRTEADERVLITTLTKRMAEELDEYLRGAGVRCAYIHSDIDTLERVQIIGDLRKGLYDVLVGVNLLREGLDLPEVSLVIILDADKEGFLRNHRSLTQTAGRAARHVHGKVIMYADKITDSMRLTIDETARRRQIQMRYNEEHGIVPTAIKKKVDNPLENLAKQDETVPQYRVSKIYEAVTQPIIDQMDEKALQKAIDNTRRQMLQAAKELNFTEAAQLRDEMLAMQEKLNSLTNKN
ncbi:MAG: excinuclease ABC subunit UvrB [Paludibacteraceae bacterium]|nr:excinuclease ABC subunit UvrB [Paludibacteraceae bacterium]